MDNKFSQNIFIFDGDAYTRSLLLTHLARITDCSLHAHESIQSWNAAWFNTKADILVLNHHVNDVPPFEFLQWFKRTLPESYVVVISSPGQPHKAFEELRRNHACIDAIFDKPIDLDKLVLDLVELLADIRKQKELSQQKLNILRYLPTGALRRLFAQPTPGSAELFEMAVVFTDIRNSSQMIVKNSAHIYFAKLNDILASQAQLVRQYDGMVVKTTGDGLLAVFEGVARCHSALKCALAIQQSLQSQMTPVGIGISDGLIISGVLGTTEHLHFDVIGLHVHLAARLCAEAGAGEVLATQDVANKARFEFSSHTRREIYAVRGFDAPVACLHIRP